MMYIDEFQCGCGKSSTKIEIKKFYPPTEKRPHSIATFDCPFCKIGYVAECYVQSVEIEGMVEGEFPKVEMKILPLEGLG